MNRSRSIGSSPMSVVEQEGNDALHLPFLFFGNSQELFRIWIGNVLLTTVTAGAYFPWAHVKTLRYFYGKTRLDGEPYGFRADPVILLRASLLAMAVLLSCGLIVWLYPVTAPLLVAALLLLFPFVRHWYLRYRIGFSTYRDVPFEFAGSLKGAYGAYLLWPLLVFLSGGLLFRRWCAGKRDTSITDYVGVESPFDAR